MTDEDRTGRRAKSHHEGPFGRGRVRTPGLGIPIEMDPEVTPPPAVPEIDLETLPPADQIRALRGTTERLAAGLERVWDSRHDASRITRIDAAIGGIDKQLADVSALMREFLVPAVKTMMMRLDGVEQATTKSGQRLELFFTHEWPDALKSLQGFEARFERLERDYERHDRALENVTRKADEMRATDDKQAGQIRSLEDDRIATKGVTKGISSTSNVVLHLATVAIAIAGIVIALAR